MVESAIITDLVYEAAINAEIWPSALDRLGAEIEAVSGEILVFDTAESAPRFKATEFSRAALSHWIETGLWKDSVMQRVARAGCPPHPLGVLCTTDMLSDEDWHADPSSEVFKSVGLHDQLFAPIFMPMGEVVFLSFERLQRDGRFKAGAADKLSRLLPHFSRAAMVSSRLGLAYATAATETMEALGIPAAVLTSSGRLKAANGLFLSLDNIFAYGASERVRLADASADLMFRNAVNEVVSTAAVVRSIAIRAQNEILPVVVHVLPLKRSAHELLFGADVLIVVTEVGRRHEGPQPNLLMALFDLTATEARLASWLGSGGAIKDFAATTGVTEKTVRTYLERVFAKTGCRRQSELVLLLRDADLAGKPA